MRWWRGLDERLWHGVLREVITRLESISLREVISRCERVSFCGAIAGELNDGRDPVTRGSDNVLSSLLMTLAAPRLRSSPRRPSAPPRRSRLESSEVLSWRLRSRGHRAQASGSGVPAGSP
jgi:hypothetical protein